MIPPIIKEMSFTQRRNLNACSPIPHPHIPSILQCRLLISTSTAVALLRLPPSFDRTIVLTSLLFFQTSVVSPHDFILCVWPEWHFRKQNLHQTPLLKSLTLISLRRSSTSLGLSLGSNLISCISVLLQTCHAGLGLFLVQAFELSQMPHLQRNYLASLSKNNYFSTFVPTQ